MVAGAVIVAEIPETIAENSYQLTKAGKPSLCPSDTAHTFQY